MIIQSEEETVRTRPNGKGYRFQVIWNKVIKEIVLQSVRKGNTEFFMILLEAQPQYFFD